MLVSFENCAKRYDVSTETIRRWVKSGGFPAPAIRQGRTIFWQEDDLKKWEAGGQRAQAEHADLIDRELQEAQHHIKGANSEGQKQGVTIPMLDDPSTAVTEIRMLAVDLGLDPSTPCSVVGQQARAVVREARAFASRVRGS